MRKKIYVIQCFSNLNVHYAAIGFIQYAVVPPSDFKHTVFIPHHNTTVLCCKVYFYDTKCKYICTYKLSEKHKHIYICVTFKPSGILHKSNILMYLLTNNIMMSNKSFDF